MAAKKLPGPGCKPFSPSLPAPLSGALAALLRERRKRAGLTLDKLARRSGVSRQMLGYVEGRQRRPTVDLLARICTGLEISLARLIRLAQRLAAAPAACRKCHYSCVENGRLVWLNPARGCTRPGR
jgi:transcriptional regulator with XRE-family HTH domain